MEKREALSSVFIPIFSNIIKCPLEIKYRTVREENATIKNAFTALESASDKTAPQLLTTAGFQRVRQANVGTGNGGFVWTLALEDSEGARSSQLARLQEVLEQAQSEVAMLDYGGRNGKRESATFGMPAKSTEEVDLNQIRRLKELKAQRATTQQPLASIPPPSTHIDSKPQQATSASTQGTAGSSVTFVASDDEANDFTSVAHLIDKVKLTIHKTGRLRNYSFEGRDFTLRRMYHGRMAHLCGDERCLQKGKWAALDSNQESKAPITATDEVASASQSKPSTYPSSSSSDEEKGHCLEAHWHVRNANMLYSYVAHLNPTGTAVLHMGEEFGYQYNSLPGTEHFGRTVQLSIKKVNMETHLLESMKSTYKPADKCIVCGTPFAKLWL